MSALRLVEKGYRVLVLEKGKRFAATDFPESNWDLRRWMWRPELGLRGIFQMSFLRHATIFHGVGVGGGSLTYVPWHFMPDRSLQLLVMRHQQRPHWELRTRRGY